jgi:hypothetical protein
MRRTPNFRRVPAKGRETLLVHSTAKFKQKILKNILAIVFLITSFITSGQTGDTYEPFNSSDYSSDKYQVKLKTIPFSKFKIQIRQVKGKVEIPSDFYCRAWLTVTQENKILFQRYFKSIEPVGGCSGLFIPDTQPLKDFFLISKFGDYDGTIIIIDTMGNVTEKMGGDFYISKDKRYLFSNYSSDAAGLTVYDLNKRNIIYSSTSDTTESFLGAWYCKKGKYFARAYDNNEADEGQIIKIATFDFKERKLMVSKVDKFYLKKENELKSYNGEADMNCNCGN